VTLAYRVCMRLKTAIRWSIKTSEVGAYLMHRGLRRRHPGLDHRRRPLNHYRWLAFAKSCDQWASCRPETAAIAPAANNQNTHHLLCFFCLLCLPCSFKLSLYCTMITNCTSSIYPRCHSTMILDIFKKNSGNWASRPISEWPGVVIALFNVPKHLFLYQVSTSFTIKCLSDQSNGAGAFNVLKMASILKKKNSYAFQQKNKLVVRIKRYPHDHQVTGHLQTTIICRRSVDLLRGHLSTYVLFILLFISMPDINMTCPNLRRNRCQKLD